MNPRDEQIEALKERTANLDRDRLDHCYRDILKAYESESIVDSVCHLVEVRDRVPSDFAVLSNSEARRRSEFNSPSYIWELYCFDLGRSVALAEKRHLLEQLGGLPSSGATVDASAPKFSVLQDAVLQLAARGYSPNVLFAPISLFVPFNMDRNIHLDWGTGRPEALILPNDRRVEVFWSSRAAPLDRFVVLDSSAGTWNVKLDPETGHRLTVAIGETESPRDSVVFLAETVITYEITDPRGFYVVEVQGEVPEHLRQA